MAGALDNLVRVRDNVLQMLAQGAPEPDVAGYLKTEGYTVGRFRSAVKDLEEAGDVRPGEANAWDFFVQGLTGNWGDEAVSAYKAATGPSTYRQEHKAREVEREAYAAEHPIKAVGAEIAGNVGMTLGTLGTGAPRAVGNVLARLPAWQRYLAGVTSAGAGGAAAGAGASDMDERTSGALVGGAAGAGIGAAAPLVIGGIGRVSRAIGDMAGLGDLDKRADTKVLQKLEQDRMTPAQVAEQIERNAQTGLKPETIVDVGGRNTMRLARSAEAIPGGGTEEIYERLVDRATGQPGRIAGDFDQAFGSTKNGYALADEISNRQKTAADPLYKQAYAEAPAVSNGRVMELLDLPDFRRAYGRAAHIAELEGEPLQPIYASVRNGVGEGPVVNLPSLRTLDLLKRGLDDEIGTSARQGSLGNTELRALATRVKEFRTLLTESYPTYGKALSAWAGDAQLRNALEAGGEALRQSPYEVKKVFSKLGESEKEHFRIGMRQALRDLAAGAPDNADLVKRVYGNAQRRDVIDAVLGEGEATRLAEQMRREKMMRVKQDQILGNSQTARIEADKADLAGDPDTLRWLLSPREAALDTAVARARAGSPDLAGKIADRLLGWPGDYRSQLEYLKKLEAQRKLLEERARAGAGRATLGAGALGAAAGGLLGGY